MDQPTSFDIRKILEFLPHRYPFLLVDRVNEIVDGEYIKAHKCVSFNEPFFQGHFPGVPVMPGVLIIEALAQAGGLLVLHGFDPSESGREALPLLRARKGPLPASGLPRRPSGSGMPPHPPQAETVEDGRSGLR